ncbi:hypothetical protein VSR68_37015 [Paraburkholderia phymatum]|uniref:hypothetical protein n=1 Tax=Paraburkholderia phymatum TaxID=148447 RepID=UPI0031828767
MNPHATSSRQPISWTIAVIVHCASEREAGPVAPFPARLRAIDLAGRDAVDAFIGVSLEHVPLSAAGMLNTGQSTRGTPHCLASMQPGTMASSKTTALRCNFSVCRFRRREASRFELQFIHFDIQNEWYCHSLNRHGH